MLTRFNNYIPLSRICFDTMFRDIKVFPEFISIINKAVGKKGLFPGRSRVQKLDLYSYLGKRPEKSKNIPSRRVQVSMIVGITSSISITFIGHLFSVYTIGWDVLYQDLIGICTSIWQFYILEIIHPPAKCRNPVLPITYRHY